MSNYPKEITVEAAGGLTFGNYTTKDKIKINDFEHMGNIYSLRSHNEVTRLEKNSEMLIETVPGAAISNFILDDTSCSFDITGSGGAQITLSLAPETAYHLRVTGQVSEEITANRSGKLSFSADLSTESKKVILEKL